MTSIRDVWGVCCPSCSKDEHIIINASIWVSLTTDGTSDDGDHGHEWADNSPAQCTSCGWSGMVQEARMAAEGGDMSSNRFDPARFTQPYSSRSIFRDGEPFVSVRLDGEETKPTDVDEFCRLLGAAPDLLEVVKKMERFITGFEDDETQEGVTDMLNAARALIAKTEGTT